MREWRRTVRAAVKYSWLIANIELYLTGFLKRVNRPKTEKKTQKVAREKHGTRAFTKPSFTMTGAYVELTIH
jgi:hypothetical protein